MRRFEVVGSLNLFDAPVIDGEILGTIAQASDVLEQAAQKAQQIIDKAQKEREQILEEARAEGRRVVEQRRDEIDGMLAEEKAAIITQMYRNVETFLEGVRDTIPVFVENILFRVIGAFDEQQLLARCIAMGIEELRDATEMYVKVNARDYEILAELLSPWLREGSDGFIRLEQDSFTPEGECTLVTNIGTVELSLERQLEAFIQGLHQQFGTNLTESEEEEIEGQAEENQLYNYGAEEEENAEEEDDK